MTPEEKVAKNREYHRLWRAKNRASVAASGRKFRLAHPERGKIDEKRDRVKYSARRSVDNGIQWGTLVKPDSCSRCGKKCLVDAHHKDYTKKREVTWLCRQCHALEHFEERQRKTK